ncbi:MAG: helix-turn-helix domain-containing protein [Acidobacteriota bacterium]
MNEPAAPLLARALKHLRILRGRSQGDLAREAGVDPSTIRRLESGEIDLSRERLDGFGTLMRAKPGQVEKAIEFAATEDARYEALAADPRSVLIEQAHAASASGIRAALEETRHASDLAAAKEYAAARWQVLAPLKPEDRLVLVESCRDFRTPALCARLCDESERAASRSATASVAIARLALRLTELIPNFYEFPRAHGYAYAFAANSHRVANEFRLADLAFARCREGFPYGLLDPTGLFPESRVLDLEASLRRNQGRFSDAVSLLGEALAICAPGDRARVLLKQAATFEQRGEPGRALAALREALQKIPHNEDAPRFHWLLRCSEVKTLLALDRPQEAEAALHGLRRLSAERGDHLSFLRLRWLEATVTAALGGVADALVLLTSVRHSFVSISLPVDAAGVGLFQAEILLREGQNSRVRTLVAELMPTFDALNLELEALAALRLFIEAAESDAATVKMAREAANAICRLPRHA